MRNGVSGQTGSRPPREGRGSIWLVVGAAMLCPVSKLIVLASVGGALGGLLGNAWFLAGVFAVVAVGGWLGARLIRSRLAKRGRDDLLRCGTTAEVPAPDAGDEKKQREYAG